MEPDWYEDPLGRFDGRFFNGEKWTAEVSAAGTLTVDPDFGHADADEISTPVAADQLEPAVNQLEEPARPLPSELTTKTPESPVRVVAVLDESIRPALTRPETHHITVDEQSQPGQSARWRWVAAALLVAAAAIIAAVLVSGDDSSDVPVDEPVALDPEQEARVEDLVEGGAESDLDPADAQELPAIEPSEPNEPSAPSATDPDDTGASSADSDEGTQAPEPLQTPAVAAPDTSFGDEGSDPAGPITMLDEEGVIAELNDWHQAFSADQGIVLAPDAACWFAELESELHLNIYCGPIADDGTELRFDAVPIVLQDVFGGQRAQAVIGAVETNVSLPAGLLLIDSASSPSPPVTSDAPQRGGRNDSDSSDE